MTCIVQDFPRTRECGHGEAHSVEFLAGTSFDPYPTEQARTPSGVVSLIVSS
ncbi:hypothetical protein [Desulfosoma sp.]|uniref:hypothetical protein n=1 Tax=Desulfosoma sp. TaxID=2603217 RepID=UPI0040490316